MKRILTLFIADVIDWANGWINFLEHKVRRFGHRFERQKTFVVDILMARRGSYQRPFLHFSLGVLFMVGVVAAPILADSYPGAIADTLSTFTPPSAVLTSLDPSEYGVETKKSEKPRDQVVTYAVQSGDTLGKIAGQFGVSIDTIKWANDLHRDGLTIGQELKIPPVTGIVHKVKEGDTVYTIAKKYKTDAQKIVNFPFNDFADPDTFALDVGQILIVPDGVQPEAPAIFAPVSPPPIYAGGTGQLLWPTTGIVTQYPVWYHMAFDIANPSAPGVMAANDGVVIFAGYQRFGYGNHVIISHGGVLSTLYGHLTEFYVNVGDHVARGQVIGKMGSTGRSTGTHLHFEVRVNGTPVDPRMYLK